MGDNSAGEREHAARVQARPEQARKGPSQPGVSSAAVLRQLQRTAGNAAVHRLLQRQKVQREPVDTSSSAATPAAAGSTTVHADEIVGSGTLKLSAPQVGINGAQVNLNAGLARASGALQSDTLITNSVIASSYTPGAGNVM